MHQEAWENGTTAWGSGASYLGRTTLVCTTQWHRGPTGHPRHVDRWLVLGPEGTRTVTHSVVRVPAASVSQFGGSPVVARPFRQCGCSTSEQKSIFTYR